MLVIWGRINSVNVQKVLLCCEELGIEYRRIDAGGAFGIVDTPSTAAATPTASCRRSTTTDSFSGNRMRSSGISRRSIAAACGRRTRAFGRWPTSGWTGPYDVLARPPHGVPGPRPHAAGRAECRGHRGIAGCRLEGALRRLEALAAGRHLPDQRRLGVAAFVDLEEHLLLRERHRRDHLRARLGEEGEGREARLALGGGAEEEGGGGHDGCDGLHGVSPLASGLEALLLFKTGVSHVISDRKVVPAPLSRSDDGHKTGVTKFTGPGEPASRSSALRDKTHAADETGAYISSGCVFTGDSAVRGPPPYDRRRGSAVRLAGPSLIRLALNSSVSRKCCSFSAGGPHGHAVTASIKLAPAAVGATRVKARPAEARRAAYCAA